MLNEGLELLKKAAESAPDENNVRFNYAIATFLNGNFTDAATHLRAMIASRPSDGEAYYLLAKTLVELKDPAAADVDNQARRFLATGNRYATLEKEWLKTHSDQRYSAACRPACAKGFRQRCVEQHAAQPRRRLRSTRPIRFSLKLARSIRTAMMTRRWRSSDAFLPANR